MGESTTAIIVAGLTFVLGPAVTAWIGKLGRRAAKLETPEYQIPKEIPCHVTQEQLRLLVISVALLHDKLDIMSDTEIAKILAALKAREQKES